MLLLHIYTILYYLVSTSEVHHLCWPLLLTSISGVGPPQLRNVSSASCQWISSVICLFAFYSKAVLYFEVLVHDTPSCLGVPTGPEALRCEFVPHPGPQSPESRTSSFYVFAVVANTDYNSRPPATESSWIRKRLPFFPPKPPSLAL